MCPLEAYSRTILALTSAWLQVLNLTHKGKIGSDDYHITGARVRDRFTGETWDIKAKQVDARMQARVPLSCALLSALTIKVHACMSRYVHV
jgi:hypothetical protein